MICPYCKKLAMFVDNTEIYNGTRYGKSYMMFYCKICDAYVGTHDNDPKRPLGVMANKELREWRKKSHRIIDSYWKSGDLKRSWVYARLMRYFDREIHIGESNIEMCKMIAEIAPDLLEMTQVDFSKKYPRIK